MQAIIMERKPSNYHSVMVVTISPQKNSLGQLHVVSLFGGDYQFTKNSLGQSHVVSLFAMFDQRATHLHLGESEILCNLNLE